jgi:mRNA interferase HigB
MKNRALEPQQRGPGWRPARIAINPRTRNVFAQVPTQNAPTGCAKIHERTQIQESANLNSHERTQNHNTPSPFLLGKFHQFALFAFCEYSVEWGRQGQLHIISKKKLLEAGKKHESIAVSLDSWYRIAKLARWKNLEEVRQTYSHADGVPVGEKVYTVFNIAGNSFRLITQIYYGDQVLIRHVLTHAEYDKGNWKK